MLYERIRPNPALADLVESIWIQDNPDPSPRAPSRVVPTGTVEILFQYGDRMAHLEPDGVVAMPRTYVAGPRTRPILALATGRVGIVLVSLYPWGLRALFPAGVEAPDGYADLALLDRGERVRILEERLVAAADARERVRLVETFLIGRRHHDVDDSMRVATGILARADRSLSDAALALSMSQRHLSRRFRAAIGMSPGVFSRVMRFQHALRLRRGRRMTWAAVAAACGYADQAHMIHEIRHFAGQSPGRIDLDSNATDAVFNGAGASSFFDTVYM